MRLYLIVTKFELKITGEQDAKLWRATPRRHPPGSGGFAATPVVAAVVRAAGGGHLTSDRAASAHGAPPVSPR